LQKIILKHNLEGRIIFTGFRKDVLNLLKLMNVLVIASLVDSFGRIAIEAMVAGAPVLSANAGGVPEIIGHEKNGFLMESREPEVIANALESIFNNPEKVKEVIKFGRLSIMERFSLDKHVQRIEQVLDECLR